MELQIITPEKKIYDGQVDAVSVPGADGGFQMLKDHAPIVSSLISGKIRVKKQNASDGEFSHFEKDGSEWIYELDGAGFVENNNNKIVILIE